MSIWVRALCKKSVSQVTPEKLQQGIAARLTALIELFCPMDEEKPEEFLQRLQVKSEAEGSFESLAIHFRKDSDEPVRVERWHGPQAVEDIKEMCESLKGRKNPIIKDVISKLEGAIETVGIELDDTDFEEMGFPMAVAGAAWLAEVGDGVVFADNCGWMAPVENGVKFILRE